MDFLFHAEELVDIHQSLFCWLSVIILFALWDGIYQISEYMCLAVCPYAVSEFIVPQYHSNYLS